MNPPSNTSRSKSEARALSVRRALIITIAGACASFNFTAIGAMPAVMALQESAHDTASTPSTSKPAEFAANIAATGDPARDLAVLGDRAANGLDWPLFRGDRAMTGVARCVLPEKLELRWTFNAGEPVGSTAAIAGGVVYVGSDAGVVHAIDLASGNELWRFGPATPSISATRFPATSQASTQNATRPASTTRDADSSPAIQSSADASPIQSAITVFDGSVYFGDSDGRFFRLSLAGAELWRFVTDGEILGGANVAPGRVFFASYDGSVRCLSTAGALQWEFKTESKVHATPAFADGKLLISGCDGWLRVLDPNDGSELSKTSLGAYVGATPAVSGTLTFMGTYGERVLCVDWKEGREIWHYEHAVRKFPYLSSAALSDSRVILGGRDKIFRALDRKSGEPVWEISTNARIDGSSVISGGRVFIGTGDGVILAIDIAIGRKVWSYEGCGPFSASPAIADGCLVIGDEDGNVRCFSESRK